MGYPEAPRLVSKGKPSENWGSCAVSIIYVNHIPSLATLLKSIGVARCGSAAQRCRALDRQPAGGGRKAIDGWPLLGHGGIGHTARKRSTTYENPGGGIGDTLVDKAGTIRPLIRFAGSHASPV